MSRLRNLLELVKFAHTLFALPFALGSMLLAAHGLPPARIIGWILVAMVGARTAAMGWNRIIDRDIDARNPRTSGREIPSGKVSVVQAGALVAFSALAFCVAAWQLNALAAWLALPTLAVLFFYSFCKRFTSLAHLVLGACLGIAPVGAWVAVTGKIEPAPVVLGLGVMLWVAGFDIIYATMDDEFDREAGLHSMVQKFGVAGALKLSRALHAGFVLLLLGFGWMLGLSGWFWAGTLAIGAFLVYEHALVNPRDLRRVNAAFFSVNGGISMFFLALAMLEAWRMS